MSQFEKAVKQSDEQFLRAVGIDKAAFNLILERVATYFEKLKEERPMKKRGKKSEVALADRLLLTFTYLHHYPTFARWFFRVKCGNETCYRGMRFFYECKLI